MHFLTSWHDVQLMFWMERFLESPGKKGFLSPGKPLNLVFPSPRKSWRKAFECLYEPWPPLECRQRHSVFRLCIHVCSNNTSLFIWQLSAGLKEKQSHTNKSTHSKLHYWKLVKENGIKEFWKRVVRVRTDGYGFADHNCSVNCESRLASSKEWRTWDWSLTIRLNINAHCSRRLSDNLLSDYLHII